MTAPALFGRWTSLALGLAIGVTPEEAALVVAATLQVLATTSALRPTIVRAFAAIASTAWPYVSKLAGLGATLSFTSARIS